MAHTTASLHEAKRVNLHTHSRYCGHGSGELAQYVETAKSSGLSLLGISEHCPVPDHRWHRSRMAFHQLETYMDECRNLQNATQELQIVCGFECDHHPQYTNWYRERLIDSGFADYLIFGVHFLSDSNLSDVFVRKLPATRAWLHTYTDLYLDGLNSGLYQFGVHPDLFGMFYTRWDQEAISCSQAILSCAESANIPLEINGYGCRKPMIETDEGMRWQYPIRQFWELASQYDLQVIVNSDAHRPEDLDISGIGAYELAQQFDLNLVDWQVDSSQRVSPVTRGDRFTSISAIL